MASPYGLTSNGLLVPSTLQVLKQINDDMAASPALDPNINTSADSVQGQENGVVADAIEQVWEVAQIAYNANNPDAAEDFLLDAVCALTGTLRQPATPSTFSGNNLIWVGLAPNVAVPIGSVFGQLGNPSNQFITILPTSSPLGAPDKSTVTGVAAGVFTTSTPHNLTLGMAVILGTTGTFPTGSGSNVVANSVYYVIAANLAASTFSLAKVAAGVLLNVTGGTGTLSVYPAYSIPQAQCTIAGPTPCNALTLSVIATPISGMYVVTNPSSAFLGTLQDTDPQLRLRRETELRASGSGSIPAIEASLREIEVNGIQPILAVKMYENTSDKADFFTNLPGHSFEALVNDFFGTYGANPGTNPVGLVPNNTIAQTIWNNKPAGIQSSGNTSGIALDSQGNQQTVSFSRPSLLELQFYVQMRVKSGIYDTTNIVAATAIVGALGANTKSGQIICFSWFFAALAAIDGVLSVEVVNIGSSISSGTNNQDFGPVGLRQYAWTQTGDITFNNTVVT